MLLNPASEADCHGAQPRKSEAPPRGAAEFEGQAAAKAHAGREDPALWKSRGDPPKRGRGGGAPLGSRKGGPDPQTRARVMGSRPSHRVRRYPANSMIAAVGALATPMPIGLHHGTLSIHACAREGLAQDFPTLKQMA